MAYKAVNENFKDLWSGDFDNSVGSTCEVPRKDVDSNRDRGCSHGLHVGAIDYAAQYGGIDLKDRDDDDGGNNIVICKVNPMDVVSVPTCSRFQKLRCCQYEVAAIFDDVFDKSVEMFGNKTDNVRVVKYNDAWKEDVRVRLERLSTVLSNQTVGA